MTSERLGAGGLEGAQTANMMQRMAGAYLLALGRLMADFSAAAAFLLSDPVFRRLGFDEQLLAATARAMDSDSAAQRDPAAARERARALLSQTEAVLGRLRAAAAERRALLERERVSGVSVAATAAAVTERAEEALRSRLATELEPSQMEACSDPEVLAGKLNSVGSAVFGQVRKEWEPVYAELGNASLPPAPLFLSLRQIYIETVKLLNQHRLAAGERAGASDRRAGGLLGLRRDERRASTAHVEPQILAQVVDGVVEVIRSSLQQWNSSALARAQRQFRREALASAGGPLSQEELSRELALVERSAGQLAALRRELARGLSVRYFLLKTICGSA